MAPRLLRLGPRLSTLPALGLCAVLGCAGAGKGGGSGTAGTSSSPGSAGTNGAGTAGTTGSAATTGTAGTSASGTAGTSASGTAGTSASGTAGTSASGTAGTSASGTAGTTGAAGTTGTSGSSGTTDAGTDMVCQMAEINWVPQIPTVFILVDRSGSEFTDMTTGVFFNLRTAVLQVLQNLDTANTQIRIGIGSFVGDHASGACVDNFMMSPIDNINNNYAALMTAYNGWGPLLPFGSKADTPMYDAITKVKAILQADQGTTGSKYMLIVTDGETDFCDDGNLVCPADVVASEIQDMYTAGLGTLVLGLPSSNATTYGAILQNYANAGAGQNVGLPPNVTTGTDVYNQCNGVAPWKAAYTAAGRTTMGAIATNATPAGTAKVFTPSSTSTTDLANQIATAINGVKSCSFDLSDIGGKSIKVDTTKLNQATVKIGTTTVPLDPTNGWNVDPSAPTTLTLNGTACATWRMPANTKIDLNFPCSSIIFE